MQKINEMTDREAAQKGFSEHYAEGNTPWDIGRPKPPFIAITDKVVEPVLDAGCGTGDTSIFFAARGLKVIGIDFVEAAIRKAESKAAGRGLPVEFMVKDAVDLENWDRKFNTVIDSGLLHACWNRQKYVKGLGHVLNPGGHLFLYYFIADPSSPGGGISDDELKKFFTEGWEIESIQSADFSGEDSSEWKMNFAIIRRIS